MPIYEEKIISPLATRFTQQRIRETFRDGHEVEATIKQITAAPGTGDYDIILEAPFPAIEIIRWAPNGRSSGTGEHWFSFDNRRLYCLQRCAAKYWPKRVGAIVEVLYADSGTIRKKLDSQTCGQSVSIGHAFAVAGELQEWTWRKAVQECRLQEHFALQADAAVVADDAKTSVHELTGAPVLSSFEKLARAEMCMQAEPPKPTSSLQEGAIEGNQASETSKGEALPAQENSLTDLIGQLFHTELPKPTPSIQEEATEGNQAQIISTGEALPTQESSLTDLIGQLLILKPNEESREHTSDASSSTHLSEHTERTESVGSSLESTPTPTDPEVTTEREAEDAAQQDCMPKKCADATSKQRRATKKVGNEPRSAKGTKQAQAAWQAQALQNQMAHYQMAAWQQQAQWQAAAQYAQWQHASFAFQASQAAQFQQGRQHF